MKRFLLVVAFLMFVTPPAWAGLDVGGIRVTADSVIGTTGVPTVLYGWCIVSGGTAGDVIFRNGISTSGGILLEDKGTANEGVPNDLGGIGVVFPNGLFADIDADVDSLIVYFRKR